MPKIRVHLHELVPAFHNGGKAHFYLDKQTGQVLMDYEGAMYDEQGDDIRQALVENPLRFVEIESIGKGETLRMMRAFIDQCAAGPIRTQLEQALQSQRPFQNFRNIVGSYPECAREWQKFEGKYTKSLARQWLKDHGVDATLYVPKPVQVAES